MGNAKSGVGRDAQLTNYKNNRTWERNRLRKLAKTMESQPNNTQVEQAIAGVSYRRKTPKTRVWSKSKIYTAQLFKYFSGHVDLNIFSNNEKTATSAQVSHRMKWDFKPTGVNEKTMFSLGARAHTRGNRWG